MTVFAFFFNFFTENKLNSSELSGVQKIRMKSQDLFTMKNNIKSPECCLLQILPGTFSINMVIKDFVIC